MVVVEAERKRLYMKAIRGDGFDVLGLRGYVSWREGRVCGQSEGGGGLGTSLSASDHFAKNKKCLGLTPNNLGFAFLFFLKVQIELISTNRRTF